MILNDEDVKERIESPINLLNRLRTSLDKASKSRESGIPSLPPKSSDIISNLEDKLNEASSKNKAKKIMNLAMDELELRISEVQKPEKLAAIANDMNKIVTANEAKGGGDRFSQIVIYAPQVQPIENYEIIDIKE